MKLTALQALLSAVLTGEALVLAAPTTPSNSSTLAPRMDLAVDCYDYGYRCDASYGFKKADTLNLDAIVQNIPNSDTKSTRCKIIDCIGNLCVWPMKSGVSWTSIQAASKALADNCGLDDKGFSDGKGCGASAFDPTADDPWDSGYLQFGYAPDSENHPGGFPGTDVCGARSGG